MLVARSCVMAPSTKQKILLVVVLRALLFVAPFLLVLALAPANPWLVALWVLCLCLSSLAAGLI